MECSTEVKNNQLEMHTSISSDLKNSTGQNLHQDMDSIILLIRF